VPAGEYAQGRAEWFSTSVGAPTLHISADLVLGLVEEHVSVDGATTVWGDEIVCSPGYPAGTAFWAGRIDVFMSAVSVATLVAALRNQAVVQANMVAAVDMAPCTVVRIGG
jgi:hypothetical protein